MEINVNLVIGNTITRELLERFLGGQCSCTVDQTYANVVDAMAGLARQQVDLVLVDSSLRDGLNLLHWLKMKSSAPRLLVMLAQSDARFIDECIAAGADGFITAQDSLEDLRQCLPSVLEGKQRLPRDYQPHGVRAVASFNGKKAANGLQSRLTAQQTRIIQLIESGCSNKEIAEHLGIRLATVKNHVHQILERLNVKSRCEAAAVYRRFGRRPAAAETRSQAFDALNDRWQPRLLETESVASGSGNTLQESRARSEA